MVATAAPVAAGRPGQARRGGGDRGVRAGRDRLTPAGTERLRGHRFSCALQRLPRRALRRTGAYRRTARPGRRGDAELDPVRTGPAGWGVRRLEPVHRWWVPAGGNAEPGYRFTAVVALLGDAGMAGSGVHQASGARLRDRRDVPVP